MATAGLLANSTAVVIGAMLVAPLLNPILAGSWALAAARWDVLRPAAGTLVVSIGIALAVSAGFGGLIYYLVSPILPAPTSELLARSQPNLVDLMIALVGGLTGAYALTRSNVSAALPGVAIATALMPALCTVGLSLARLDVQLASGASLLFITNLAAIAFSATVVFFLRGVGLVDGLRRGPLLVLGGSVLVVALVLGLLSYAAIAEGVRGRTLATLLVDGLGGPAAVQLVDLTQDDASYGLAVRATVRATEAVSPERVRAIQAEMAEATGTVISLQLSVLPLEVIQPSIPARPSP